MKDLANIKLASTIVLAILVATIGSNFGNLMQKASADYDSTNAVALSQEIDQANFCEELGLEGNFAICSNTALQDIILYSIQTSEGWGDDTEYSNLINIEQIINQGNMSGNRYWIKQCILF